MRRHFLWSVAAALIGVSSVCAEPLVGVDYIFVDAGGSSYGDDFDDGVLGPEWQVLDGSPGPEADSVLPMNNSDFIINTTPIAPGTDVTIAALLTENLGPDDFVFLVVFAENREDWFAVGLTGQAVFATDELLEPLNIDGYIGPDVGFKLIYNAATSVLTATANDTVIFDDNPNLAGGIAEVGIVVVPEPATMPLIVFATAWLLLPRKRWR